ncbi:hypothetical protein RM531_03370 [Salinisphaera sp. P385]|uniref:Isoquinoline 1-oxidoreductase subunit n=1 Tax=Spectribacter acetivorans TaxID=3075603 RepID=A0ABU3B4W8_9GAMM|nr:hypothetical protein [Salinisphaera sp. P385]MDT0617501.1 hypothetical protein [Salinisphaera sp. P385]
MKTFGLTIVLSLFLVTALPANSADNDTELRGPDAFSDIEDDTERARAMFGEAGKVIQHPRCVNCHPKGDSPRQGMAMELHEPPVRRGPANFGVTGMRCFTCHNPENVAAGGVPGNPAWHLAPKSQAWYGKSLGEICEQIKDTERNGGMSMDELVEHMAEDSLVGWGWEPGGDREPVPGDWETFGNLIAAWADAGAHCPAP